jgi:hypothetical protein
MQINVRRYARNDKDAWNDFLPGAKNATFLFDRNYVEYHSKRYKDHSVLIYSGDAISALFVADEVGDEIYSHGGLTYGGLILKKDATLQEVLTYFYHIVRYYSDNYKSIYYKCFPQYLASISAQEDLYALFLLEAKLERRDTNCVIDRSRPLPYGSLKRRTINKASKAGLSIRLSDNVSVYWNEVLTPNLHERHNVYPVHSDEEMKLLMSRFPENIKLYEIHDKTILAGIVIFETPMAAHSQYIAATPAGKEVGALDMLFNHLITEVYKEKAFFSFGISNEMAGRILNGGLTQWKEGFGARTYTQDSYRIDTSAYSRLAEYA